MATKLAFHKGFSKVADDSMMGRFANSALNAFGGGTKPKPMNVPKPPTPPSDVSAGKTMNQRMGNPFG